MRRIKVSKRKAFLVLSLLLSSDVYSGIAVTQVHAETVASSFTLTNGNITDANGKLEAKVTVTPMVSNYSESIVVVFQLMNGTVPLAIKSVPLRDNTQVNDVRAVFDTVVKPNYKVKVFVRDRLAGSGNVGTSLAEATMIPNEAPAASHVAITGTTTVGQTLKGSYTYSDAEDNVEGTSTFKWYRAEDAIGTNKEAIAGATSKTYTLVSEDEGKYIFFEVTPVASIGTTIGTSVVSTASAQIAAAPNHAPTVKNTISPVTAKVTEGVQSVSLADVFADEDQDALTYSAVSSNTGVATVAVNGSNLSITPVNAGTTTITVTADDGKGGTVQTQFTVTLTPANAANHAPTVKNAISPVTAKVTEGVQSVSLAEVFADEDQDALTYSAVSSNTGVATVAVNGSNMSITPVNAGTTTITVMADDGKGGTVQTQFAVTLTPANAPNHAPTVKNTISPVTIFAGDQSTSISLAGKFEDQDDDTLTYSAVSSDTSVAEVSVTGDQLSITPLTADTVMITVTADDGKGGTVQTQFDVTVQPSKTLFISELVWGDEFLQFIELYNPTNQDIDVTKIHIERDDDGAQITINSDPHDVIPKESTFTIAELFYGGDVYYDSYADMSFYNDTSKPVTLKLYYEYKANEYKLLDIATFFPSKSMGRVSGTVRGNTNMYDPNEWNDEGDSYTDGLNSYTP